MDFIQHNAIQYFIDDAKHQVIVKGSADGLIDCIEGIEKERRKYLSVRYDYAKEFDLMRRYEAGEIDGFQLHEALNSPQITFGVYHRLQLRVDLFGDYGDESLFFRYFSNDLPDEDPEVTFPRIKSTFEAVLEKHV